jgi:hypothetical protein
LLLSFLASIHLSDILSLCFPSRISCAKNVEKAKETVVVIGGLHLLRLGQRQTQKKEREKEGGRKERRKEGRMTAFFR